MRILILLILASMLIGCGGVKVQPVEGIGGMRGMEAAEKLDYPPGAPVGLGE